MTYKGAATSMLRICCWCDKRLGNKVPLEQDEVTGSLCDGCCHKLLEDIRMESGWTYHVMLSRECAHLFNNVSLLLQVQPHVKVVVDRRRRNGEPPVSPPPHPGPLGVSSLFPRRHHLVIRRDCPDLVEDLATAFAGRQDILVLVDRRGRSRTPLDSPRSGSPEQRVADPPAFLG